MKVVYIAVGVFSLILGLAGVLLPVIPGMPFLALAAYCFSRSSPRLHTWLLSLPYLGPIVKDWDKYRRMNPWTKWATIAGMALMFAALIAFVKFPVYAKIAWGVTGSIMIVLAAVQLKSK